MICRGDGNVHWLRHPQAEHPLLPGPSTVWSVVAPPQLPLLSIQSTSTHQSAPGCRPNQQHHNININNINNINNNINININKTQQKFNTALPSPECGPG